MTPLLLELCLGLVGGVAFVALARAAGPLERPVLAGVLVVAAVAYVVLGSTTRPGPDLLPQIVGSLSFLALGALGIWSSIWFLALGWTLHAAWDLVLPGLSDVSYMPGWYAAVCVAFDSVVALYLVGRASGRIPP